MKQAGCNDTWWKLAKDCIIYLLFIYFWDFLSLIQVTPQFHSTLATSSNYFLFECWDYKHVPPRLVWNDCTIDFVLSIVFQICICFYVCTSQSTHEVRSCPSTLLGQALSVLPSYWILQITACPKSLYSTVPAFHLEVKMQGLHMSATLTSFPSGFRDPIQVVRFAHQVFLTH